MHFSQLDFSTNSTEESMVVGTGKTATFAIGILQVN